MKDRAQMRRIKTVRAACIQEMTTNATPPHDPEQLVSLPAAAARLNVSLRSLYRLMAQREIPPPLKVGRSSKLCESDLDSYLNRLKSQRL